MNRSLRPASVRLRLTLWYLAAMVIVLAIYSATLLTFVNRGASRALDNRLRGDFRWAAEMAERRPDGTLSWFEGATGDDEESPWLQVWSLAGELLFKTAIVERQPIPQANDLARHPDGRIVAVPTATVPFRVLTGHSRVADRPVVIQVARSESGMRRTMRELFLTLMLSLPLGVLAAGVGGYSLARRALAPVESTFEQMRRFTGDVSHELRTPLTAIRSVGEVGLREHHDESAYRGIIGSMLEEVDKLSYLVDQLLALSRAETGGARPAAEVVDLHALADDVATHLSVLAEEKRQSLTVRADGHPQSIADRLVLRQALINLVDNAVKYTPEGGRIEIRVAAAAGGPAIEVADTGPGIPPESATRIFDRFYRGPRPDADDRGGTGLGLALAKWGVEVNGGRLTLASSGPRGSTFRIELPAAAV